MAKLVYPFGYEWSVATHIEDVSLEASQIIRGLLTQYKALCFNVSGYYALESSIHRLACSSVLSINRSSIQGSGDGGSGLLSSCGVLVDAIAFSTATIFSPAIAASEIDGSILSLVHTGVLGLLTPRARSRSTCSETLTTERLNCPQNRMLEILEAFLACLSLAALSMFVFYSQVSS